jgi:hypothetical protein
LGRKAIHRKEMNESTFNRRLRLRMEELGVLIYRIESHATCPGIPDNYYLTKFGRSSGWLEMKQARTMPHAIDYRPYQVPWLLDYSRRGGKCFTVLGIEDRKEVVVIPGDQALTASRNLKLAACRTFHEDRAGCWPGVLLLLEDGWWTKRTAPKSL